MLTCGIQCLTCDYPIHFDTYKGCSHACKYCFVKQKYSIANITPIKQVKALTDFINGKRDRETRWCDWNIPLHWGGNSDPFQECERVYKYSLDCLKVFAETKYPFIVSTKNPLMLLEDDYLSLISECRCVLQVSMACSKYDKLETGCPTYQQRLEACAKLSDKVTRIIARVRPYFPDCHKEILAEIPNYAKAGIYGISISSFVSKKKQKGMKRYGTNYMFDIDLLVPRFREIKKACHENGLKFFCCEDGLEHWSDSLSCCGTMGLDDFIPNTYNIGHIALDDVTPKPTDAMNQLKTHQPFKCIGQSQTWAKQIEYKSFADLIMQCGGNRIDYIRDMRDKYKE